MKTKILLVAIAYLDFVVLGLSSGLLGVAWPSIRQTFGAPLDAVGALLVTTTAGYLLASFTSGASIAHIGVGGFLLVGSLVAGAGPLGYTAAPAWWVMVVIGFIAGLGSGVVDAGLNTYIATNHGPTLMNWLHASFGLGATLGPLLMTGIIERGYSWRWGYVVVATLNLVLALGFTFTLRYWQLKETQPTHPSAAPAKKASSLDTLSLPIAWLGIVLFVVFTGIEGSAGQWAYSLFTTARAMPAAVAGTWVSVYWGVFTVGRILFGFVAARVGLIPLLRTCTAGAIVGAALLWSNVNDTASCLGLALIGLCVAPLYPSSTSITPRRVGEAHAANAIGFQVAAGGLGFALLPGLAGVLARTMGLEIVGPFLVVVSAVMLLVHEAIVRREPPSA
jgi:fucose permease